MHAVSPYVVKSSWKWLALQICVIADTISCVVDLLLGRLKYISPCWPSLKWQLFSLHVSSGFCTPWETFHVMRDNCCSFVGWTVDMVSKRVGEALVTWLQSIVFISAPPIPKLGENYLLHVYHHCPPFSCKLVVCVSFPSPSLLPYFLHSLLSSPSPPPYPSHLTPPSSTLSSRGSFGKLGDKDHYYHLEPLNQLDTSVRNSIIVCVYALS